MAFALLGMLLFPVLLVLLGELVEWLKSHPILGNVILWGVCTPLLALLCGLVLSRV